VLENEGNTAYIHVDSNGEGILGSCLPSGGKSDDEGLHIECPDSKKLKVENCNE
jgi:hypothetical protein